MFVLKGECVWSYYIQNIFKTMQCFWYIPLSGITAIAKICFYKRSLVLVLILISLFTHWNHKQPVWGGSPHTLFSGGFFKIPILPPGGHKELRSVRVAMCSPKCIWGCRVLWLQWWSPGPKAKGKCGSTLCSEHTVLKGKEVRGNDTGLRTAPSESLMLGLSHRTSSAQSLPHGKYLIFVDASIIISLRWRHVVGARGNKRLTQSPLLKGTVVFEGRSER